jgi:hypothetical protein
MLESSRRPMVRGRSAYQNLEGQATGLTTKARVEFARAARED